MEINLEYLKEIYNKISKEDREEQNINNFEDFMEYIKAIIIDNMYYDFDLKGTINVGKMFKILR